MGEFDVAKSEWLGMTATARPCCGILFTGSATVVGTPKRRMVQSCNTTKMWDRWLELHSFCLRQVVLAGVQLLLGCAEPRGVRMVGG